MLDEVADNYQQVKYMLIFLTGILIGFVGTSQLTPSPKACQIVYVAQDELMALENDRVKNNDLDNRQLFFAEIDKAVELATSLPKAYQKSNVKVIYSLSKVTGDNVRSISQEVHQQIIKRLSEK